MAVTETGMGKTVGMIKYMLSESAWRSMQAMNHLVILCLQVPKKYAGQGLGSRLIQE
jgi:predicted N-acetyltransferase YhbS